jgi:hypothetical protein
MHGKCGKEQSTKAVRSAAFLSNAWCTQATVKIRFRKYETSTQKRAQLQLCSAGSAITKAGIGCQLAAGPRKNRGWFSESCRDCTHPEANSLKGQGEHHLLKVQGLALALFHCCLMICCLVRINLVLLEHCHDHTRKDFSITRFSMSRFMTGSPQTSDTDRRGFQA